ncbi:MAG: hypothetical protein RL662_1153 [Bacteroidota bacterium]
MNKKVLFFSLLLSGGVLFASAQDESSRTLMLDEVEYGQSNQTYNTYKTTWKKNQLKDNWILSVGAGGQVIFGEDDSKADLTDRITLAPQFSIGKYFSPIWGLKLNFTGGGLHGYNDGRAGVYQYWNKVGYVGGLLNASVDPVWQFNGWVDINGNTITIKDPSQIQIQGTEYVWLPGDRGELYQQKIHYAGASLNFMFDAINLFSSYNPKRFFEITPFAGAGYYRRLANQGNLTSNFLGVNAGLTFKFRLAERVNFNIEGNAIYLPSAFDGHQGSERDADGIVQATAGLSYRLGKTDWEVLEPMDYELINRLNDEINDLRNRPDKICPTCLPCPPSVEAPKQDIVFLPDPVFFKIDKAIIDPTEWSKIEKAVDYLTKNSSVNVVVTGYADKKTAYPEYNMKLSERRAKTVATALTEKYGINPSRVSINWAGDQIQPFKVNEWNRVVIFVIE